MDPNQFKMFLEHQTNLFSQLLQGMQASSKQTAAQVQTQAQSAVQRPSASSIQVPQPSPLVVEGDMRENFEFFQKSWKDYAKAIGMDRWPVEENSQKVSFLLSVIGETARKKYFNFELTEAEKANPEAALEAIRSKVVTKRNIIVDRLDFFSAVQNTNECIDDYVSRLKNLAKIAQLGQLETDLITYKVVTSNKWKKMRAKLLGIEDVTLLKAIDTCRTEEITSIRCLELFTETLDVEVNKIEKKKTRLRKQAQRCKFCGDKHDFTKGSCPALGKRCHRCKGKNHFERVCKASNTSRNRRTKRVKEVKDEFEQSASSENDTSSNESDTECEIGKICDNSNKGGSVLAELDLKFSQKWKKVQCEVDTGANTSLIGVDWLKKLSESENVKIQPSTLRLQSFGGSPINVLGQVKIPCRRKGRRFRLVLQVVDVNHRPLLSAKASRMLGFVKFCKSVVFGSANANLSSEELFKVYRIEARKVVEKYSELFRGYGKFAGTVSLEVDSNVVPSIQSPRRVPIAMRDKLQKELESLENDGIIVKEKMHTEWVSNIVIVQRAGPESENIRICLDPIPLNKALKRPNLQFNTLDEILPELGKAKVFSTVDAKKGFWHVELDENSSKLTTFWTPFGRYRWTRLPFGISSAPEIFQMKLQEVIQGLSGVECLADDLLVFGSGDTLKEALENHNKCLQKLFQCLAEQNVKLNKSKLKLCQSSVKFYGHVLTDNGLQPDESKISTIQHFPVPLNRKEVHRFVGMVNYLSRYIPNLSANLTNLRKLISESVTWSWGKAEDDEFECVKRLVSDVKTLRYYNPKAPLVIECDASCFGLGVAVYQNEGVIGYASRTLTPTERNYAQIEKELLAILFACVRFDQLVVGNPKVTIKTDHKPLINVFRKPLLSAPRRLQHMLLNLQRYNLEIKFVTGKDNVVADTLSRAPFDDKELKKDFKKLNIYKVFHDVEDIQLSRFLNVSDSCLAEIKKETEQDYTLQMVAEFVRRGWPKSMVHLPDATKIYFNCRSELSTQDGIVFRDDRIVVPYKIRRKLIEKCHTSHNGTEATLKLARANLFWPGMSSQIKDWVKQCNVCAKYAASQPNPPMLSHGIPVYPFQLVSMDVFFCEYQGKNQKFLVTVDHYSDFFEVDILKDLTPESVIAACRKNFARHGKPQRILTDNATNFINQKMASFTAEWDIEHITSAPHHQQANGKSEAAVKIAKRLLKKAADTNTDFWFALLHWRNIPNNVGSSPVARLFSRSTRCGIPTSAAKLLPKVVENVPASIENNRRKTKLHYDKKTRNLPILQTGSPVFVQLNPETSKLWTPGKITSCLSDRSYVVQVDGANYRRSLKHLKPRKEPDTSPDRSSPKKSFFVQPGENLNRSDSSCVNNNLDLSPDFQMDVLHSSPASMDYLPCQSPRLPNIPNLAPNVSATAPSGCQSPKPVSEQRECRPKRASRLPVKFDDYQVEFK
ncbi:uncharacterized protein K02A2.6-like [Sabethes cyaneus]|uniref:uncharacterized protein K02A2.6-like n=1 Tax=Sabethes cyaneus TaxID=53552 RepID=UPI00237EB719|nr:uncharacterized protein K02A2.6-like [Sabethes cyaneus]